MSEVTSSQKQQENIKLTMLEAFKQAILDTCKNDADKINCEKWKKKVNEVITTVSGISEEEKKIMEKEYQQWYLI